MRELKSSIVGILVGLSILTVPAQVTNIGTITVDNRLVWDASTWQYGGQFYYQIYLAPPAQFTNFASFALIGSVSTNEWRGSSATAGLDGLYAIAIKGIATRQVTNIVGTNTSVVTITNASEPSVPVLVALRGGAPSTPRNLQLWQVVTAAATNALPTFPPPPNP